MDKEKKMRLTYIGVAMLLHRMTAYFLAYVFYTLTDDVSNAVTILATLAIYLISFAVPFFLIALSYPLKIREDSQPKPQVAAGVFYSAFSIMGLSYVASKLGNVIVASLSHFNIFEVESEITYTGDVGSFILYFIFFVIIAPVVEEIFYRGIVLQTLSPFGSRTALIFSTLFFALSHGPLSGILYALVSGLFFGALVIKHKSLKFSIIAHTINNLISFVLSVSLEYVGNIGDRIINFVFPLAAVLCGIWWFFTYGKYLLDLRKTEKFLPVFFYPPILLYLIAEAFIFFTKFYRG